MRVARAAASRLETGCRTLSIQLSVPGCRPSMPSISTSRTSPMRAQLRVARSEEARAQDLAVAVLEVLALDPPRLRHRRLLPPAQRGRLSQRPRLSLRSRARVNGQGHRVSLVT